MKKYVIENLRKEAGLTKDQLANKLGVSKMQVYRWENIEIGSNTYIKDENVRALCDFFNITEDELYNVDRENWIETAKMDGANCANSKIDAHRLSKYKSQILDALKNNDRDRVSELLLMLSSESQVEFQFFYRWLSIKEIENEKEYVYAFLASAIKREEI